MLPCWAWACPLVLFITSTTEAGRVGERPYARGRSYREDRYDDKE